MQKIILMLFAILFAIPTYAQRERSLLKVRDQAGRMITAEINGRRYDKVSKMLTFKDLPPRNHSLRLYVVTRTRSGQRKARLIYTGRLRTKPGKIYYVTVDEYEKLDVIVDCCLGDNGPWNEPNTWYRSRYYDQLEWEDDIQFNPQRDTYYNYEEGDQSRKRYKRKYRKDDWNRYQTGMSNARFNNLIEQMQNAGFETNRLNTVKLALENNHLTTTQLVKIMEEMSFESSRLNIAKMAYDKIVDKENIYRISNGFSFSSSKDEFSRFVKNQRR